MNQKMSMSGIQVPPEIVKKYEEKRFEKRAGGLVLKIDEDQVILDVEVDEDFASMVDALPDNQPRFILYDLPVKNRANLEALKTIFIFWMPMDSAVALRMKYASTKSTITREFRGIAMQMQPDDKDELTLQKVTDKLNRQQGINNSAI